MTALAVEKLDLRIGSNVVLCDVSFTLDAGETLGLVGESGSGKSMLALAIMGLLPPAAIATGSVRLDDVELIGAPEGVLNRLRGNDLAMVFQEPMTALNPLMTVGAQVGETLRLHGVRDDGERVRAALDRVGLEAVSQNRYPHELSGGQRQRVVIAMATVLSPRVLLADEPTTALDVLVQRRVLDLLQSLAREERTGLLMISHDLAVVAERADRLLVLREGRIVEHGRTRDVLRAPKHGYTRALARASAHVPERPHRVVGAAPLLEARDLVKDYRLPRKGLFGGRARLRAVDGASLTIGRGEAVGLVGGSGCGKSTLARMVLGLEPITAGTVRFDGAAVDPTDMQAVRRRMQVVFQDPSGSFDPRHRVHRIVAEPLHLVPDLAASERRERAAAALAEVGLEADTLDRYPHQFSGGQRQRIAIARALVVRPELVIADEPVSALDVSTRAQVLDLFADLQTRLGLATLFITHDLAVVRAVCDRVYVMDAGTMVEQGPVDRVFRSPEHATTRALLEAAPNLDAIRGRWDDA